MKCEILEAVTELLRQRAILYESIKAYCKRNKQHHELIEMVDEWYALTQEISTLRELL